MSNGLSGDADFGTWAIVVVQRQWRTIKERLIIPTKHFSFDEPKIVFVSGYYFRSTSGFLVFDINALIYHSIHN